MEDHATSSVVGKAVDSLIDVAKTQIGYIWNSTENIENLKNEAENLELMRGNVQKHITSAKRKGDDLLDGVQDWVYKAGVKISDTEEIIKQEARAKKAKFGNWGTRYQYGKQATNMTSSLLQHQKTGNKFEICVSIETRAPGTLDVYENKNLEDLVTHNSALKDIIAALEDESKQIIGIYGLGGVGKTTLAMEVATRVKTDRLFADVAFTSVSQNVKVEQIKKDTGEATKQIMKREKVLIILDDVWEKLNLDELCIPSGIKYKNCKILLTSRSQDVCQEMDAQSKICVNSLPIEESWILFKRVVGKRLETEADLKPVAMKMVEECGGLPLLIQAVGNALKNKRIRSWNFALSRLKKHAPSEIDPAIRKAFTNLKLSYDYLQSEEVKSCFLLCSMFPEDRNIDLEDLVHYLVGLGKFDDLDGLEDARDRVWTAVNILTSSGLLLSSSGEGITKMHDVVRDVALLIASKGENKFLVEAGKGLKEWLPTHNSLERYTGISLMNNRISKLPDFEVHLPCLDIFIINENSELPMISNEFIRGMKEVKVLNVSNSGSPSLPQSLKLLIKLRMLNLEGNKSFHETSILGEMKDLEILNLNETGITEIPKEIGHLVNLRLLEVNKCENLSWIARGVISKLSRLEELFIDFTWVREGVYDCIVEVMNLSKLTYLDLTVRDIDDIPEQDLNSAKLKGFVIQIGECYSPFSHVSYASRSDRYLVLSIEHLRISLLKRIKKFIEVSRPVIYLNQIQNLNNIMPDLYHGGFNKLEHIQLNDCPNVSCLVDDGTRCDGDEGKTEEKFFKELKHLELWDLDNLEVLWKCPDEYISLTNLVKLYIAGCKRLERVFTVGVAQGLVNLKELKIVFCEGLEEVIWGGGRDDSANTIIVFPSLTKIYIFSSSLKSFYSGVCTIKYPSLVDVSVISCFSMKIWGPGIHETPNLKFLNGHVPLPDGPSAINDVMAKYQ